MDFQWVCAYACSRRFRNCFLTFLAFIHILTLRDIDDKNVIKAIQTTTDICNSNELAKMLFWKISNFIHCVLAAQPIFFSPFWNRDQFWLDKFLCGSLNHSHRVPSWAEKLKWYGCKFLAESIALISKINFDSDLMSATLRIPLRANTTWIEKVIIAFFVIKICVRQKQHTQFLHIFCGDILFSDKLLSYHCFLFPLSISSCALSLSSWLLLYITYCTLHVDSSISFYCLLSSIVIKTNEKNFSPINDRSCRVFLDSHQ